MSDYRNKRPEQSCQLPDAVKRPSEGEDREAARQIILKRRARFLAAALAASVAATACGGETTDSKDRQNTAGQGGTGGAEPCLSPSLGGSGGAYPCLGAGASGGTGGAEPCLTPSLGGSGGAQPCLGMAYSGEGGEAGNAGEAGKSGEAGNSGASGSAGQAGQGAFGGALPCLSPPQ